MIDEAIHRMALRMLADPAADPPGRRLPQDRGLTVEEAYELQGEVVRLREQRGETVIGYKVGCTSGPIQAQLGVDGPIFGRLFASGCLHSGVRFSYRRYANLAVEGELAVRLSRDLAGSPPSDEDCLGAIE